MTRENFTSVNVIVDKSGSMANLTTDTIGGFNTFVADQKNVPGDVAFTLCLFSTSYRLVHDAVKLASVPALNGKTYRCGGCTALLDALGTTIDNVGSKLAAMPEEERPSKVIFLIITDGEENSSREYKLDQIKSMITRQREVYSWEFVFMGANIDAISAGTSLGISATNSLNYSASSIGTKSLYSNVSRSLGSYRVASNQQVDFFNQAGNAPVDPNASADPNTTIDPTVSNVTLTGAQDLLIDPNTKVLNITPVGDVTLTGFTTVDSVHTPFLGKTQGLFGVDNVKRSGGNNQGNQ